MADIRKKECFPVFLSTILTRKTFPDFTESFRQFMLAWVFQLEQVILVVEPLKDLLAELICLLMDILQIPRA